MARLNEPPVLGESLEALKRRFIRQNREIARANSTQSQKIRTLECEASKLLSENIALREENIQLSKALERAQKTNETAIGPKIKQEVRAKLDEINALLSDVERTQHSSEMKPTPGRVGRRSIKRASNPRIWRSSFDLNEIVLAEGRLPPIFEGKMHPRKSFAADEFLETFPDLSNSTESPEPGPPPVAHFDHGDHVTATNAQDTNLQRSVREADRDDDTTSAFLSSNLETRRRRRESGLGIDVANALESSPLRRETSAKDVIDASGQPLKAGAKRKHSATEEEHRKQLPRSASQEELVPLRQQGAENQEPRALARTKSFRDLSAAKGGLKDKPAAAASATGRKALGEKPVNTDPVVSPIKARHSLKDKDKDNEKPSDKREYLHRRRERDTPKSSKPTIRQIRPIPHPSKKLGEPVHIDLPAEEAPSKDLTEPDSPRNIPPTTPFAAASDDVFSPDTAPSTARPDAPRDTPPPADDPSIRPSRRQRSTVSYAEPNLRDKMRRPTKELVDAVPTANSHRSSSIREEDRLSRSIGSESVLIKQEAQEDPQPWKLAPKTPGSPLLSKTNAITKPLQEPNKDVQHDRDADTLLAHRRRRSSALKAAASVSAMSAALDSDEEIERRSSASRETIAALVASSSKKIARARDPFSYGTSGAFTTTAAPGATSAIKPASSTKLSTSASVPALTESLSVFDLNDSPEKDNRATEMGGDGSSSKAKQIRSTSTNSATAVRRTASVSEGLGKARKEARDEQDVEVGRPPRSRRRETTGAAAAAGSEGEAVQEEGPTVARRTERAERRRRSMMV